MERAVRYSRSGGRRCQRDDRRSGIAVAGGGIASGPWCAHGRLLSLPSHVSSRSRARHRASHRRAEALGPPAAAAAASASLYIHRRSSRLQSEETAESASLCPFRLAEGPAGQWERRVAGPQPRSATRSASDVDIVQYPRRRRRRATWISADLHGPPRDPCDQRRAERASARPPIPNNN